MNNIDNAEIAELMRIVDTDLRQKWEQTMGRNLLCEQKKMEYAQAVSQSHALTIARINIYCLPISALIAIAVVVAAAFGVPAGLHRPAVAIITLLIAACPFIWTARMIQKFTGKMNQAVEIQLECSEIFARFKKSVDGLECIKDDDLLDKIDEGIVRDRLVEAALTVLDAQDVADALRWDKDASRSDVIRSAKTVDLLSKRFEAIRLIAANDFSLTFSGGSIFGDARKRLDVRRSKNTKANGVTSTR
ncbi:MAG: hypothetical protein KGI45_01125 [Patescibacteria group bacterium]|nr:hypothetical protein [Patescibacteria group bacterium]MDE1941231.1 hypothetical protein [Patescibacteria group bacterium]MDE1966659.1 hypothetical protein [Patescibacteria group bacterium]